MIQNYKKDLAKFQILLMLHSYRKRMEIFPATNHHNLQLNLCKYFPDRPANTKICLHSSRCLTFINDHKIFSTEIINKSSRRINNKGCSPDDQHICSLIARIARRITLLSKPSSYRTTSGLMIPPQIHLGIPSASFTVAAS